MATKLSQNQLSQNLDLTGKTILLPAETDAVVQYPSRPDFPTVGRLKRLYVARDTGVLWSWTGTTYQKTSPTTDEFALLEGDLALAETALAAEATARQSAIVGEAQQRQAADEALSANINALSESLSSSDSAISSLDGRVTSNEAAIAITLPGLIADAEGFIQHNTFADFPPTGRLNRLYLDKSNGTLWRWTGTTYSPVPGEQDGGTY